MHPSGICRNSSRQFPTTTLLINSLNEFSCGIVHIKFQDSSVQNEVSDGAPRAIYDVQPALFLGAWFLRTAHTYIHPFSGLTLRVPSKLLVHIHTASLVNAHHSKWDSIFQIAHTLGLLGPYSPNASSYALRASTDAQCQTSQESREYCSLSYRTRLQYQRRFAVSLCTRDTASLDSNRAVAVNIEQEYGPSQTVRHSVSSPR